MGQWVSQLDVLFHSRLDLADSQGYLPCRDRGSCQGNSTSLAWRGKVPTCGLPPDVPPQPSLGWASCSLWEPATCTDHLGPRQGGDAHTPTHPHTPSLGAAPPWLVPLTKPWGFPCPVQSRKQVSDHARGQGPHLSLGTHSGKGKRSSDVLGLSNPSSCKGEKRKGAKIATEESSLILTITTIPWGSSGIQRGMQKSTDTWGRTSSNKRKGGL